MEKKLYSLRNGLKKARKLKGITQSELAEVMEVTLKTVMNWEQGIVNPDLETVIKLADFLECDIDYLTGRLEEPTHDIAFIHKSTGLSTAAIMKLQQQSFKITDKIILSKLIEHDDYKYLMNRIEEMIFHQSDSELIKYYEALKELRKGDSSRKYLKFTMAEDFLPLIDDVLNITDMNSIKAIIRYQISNKLLEMIDDISSGKVGGPYE